MKLLKIIFLFISFILIGEVIFTIDEKLRTAEVFLETNNVEIDSKKSNCNNSIFLLGDSYTQGYGIPKGQRISEIFKFENYCLINRTQGGDDWIGYYKKYNLLSQNCKKNDIVIIGVNWNDIAYSSNDFLVKEKIVTRNKKSVVKIKDSFVTNNEAWFRRLYRKSKLANTLSRNLQNTLKRHDLALPLGDFHYLYKIGYKSKKADLDEILSTIDSLNKAKGIKSVLYLMPQFNLLSNGQYFNDFITYFENKHLETIHIINGFDDFKQKDGNEFFISVHDGHPNSKAHAVITNSIINYLNSSK